MKLSLALVSSTAHLISSSVAMCCPRAWASTSSTVSRCRLRFAKIGSLSWTTISGSFLDWVDLELHVEQVALTGTRMAEVEDELAVATPASLAGPRSCTAECARHD